MTELKQAFEAAAEAAQQLPSRPDNTTLLRLYALFKQATVGDVEGERPGAFDFKGRAKFDAWADLEGMDHDEAMTAYVELVDQLKG